MVKKMDIKDITKKIEEMIGGQLMGFHPNCTIPTNPQVCTKCGDDIPLNKNEATNLVMDADEKTRLIISVQWLCKSCMSGEGLDG